VRYLVNGASVARIYVPRITYWHLELDSHDIVLAEGLPTETYLDTGNRAAFANGGSIAIGDLDYSRRIWVERGCAPLAVAGPAVTAVRESLLARLPLLGFRATTDPASRFLADGIPLAPVVDGAWTRLLPLAGARLVTLRSRAAPPSFLDPTRRDDRSLGVMVNAIRLDGVNVDLDDSRLARGWHAPERGWRWTDGAADLVIAGARLVEIAIADGGHAYPVAAPASFGLIRPSAPRGGRHG
jgi:hypothetical protein